MFFRQILKWLFAAVALLGALLIAGCLLYNFLRPSPLAYVGFSWFFGTVTFRS
jgi:hypothetical protein